MIAPFPVHRRFTIAGLPRGTTTAGSSRSARCRAMVDTVLPVAAASIAQASTTERGTRMPTTTVAGWRRSGIVVQDRGILTVNFDGGALIRSTCLIQIVKNPEISGLPTNLD